MCTPAFAYKCNPLSLCFISYTNTNKLSQHAHTQIQEVARRRKEERVLAESFDQQTSAMVKRSVLMERQMSSRWPQKYGSRRFRFFEFLIYCAVFMPF